MNEYKLYRLKTIKQILKEAGITQGIDEGRLEFEYPEGTPVITNVMRKLFGKEILLNSFDDEILSGSYRYENENGFLFSKRWVEDAYCAEISNSFDELIGDI
jgi:hypothetical protein